MADGSANSSPTRGSRTICVAVTEENYCAVVEDPRLFREWLDEAFRLHPELFPDGFSRGFQMKDCRTPKKTQIPLRRIELPDGTAYTVRPSFVMPYMTARTDDVEKPLFLRKFGVPHWALAHVFGRNPMYWHRLECSLGRNSVVGTTVRAAAIPEHLVADEHHQTLKGEKVYIATTVGGGCCLGASVAPTASTEDLTAAYGVFRDEAKNVKPDYAPKTVNTDGWKGTQAAWLALFPAVALLRCFLHAFLKIRDRAKSLKEKFHELSTRVWDAYRAPTKLDMVKALRSLQTWARENVGGVVLETVRDLCRKRKLYPKISPALGFPARTVS